MVSLSIVLCVVLILPLTYSIPCSYGKPNDVLDKGPPISKGTSVDKLIDHKKATEIMSRPPTKSKPLIECASRSMLINEEGPNSRNVLISAETRWYKADDGRTWFVPIVMDSEFTQKEASMIFAGMVNIQDATCLRFHIYKETDLQSYDYVRIERGSGQGCFSSVGRISTGKQILNLQPDEGHGSCIFPGIAAHELLHAIGLDHQQNTPGRNQFVTILWDNILSEQRHNFQEDDPNTFTSYGTDYDYGSIMHYGTKDFSNNGEDTILVKNGAPVGQRKAISSIDSLKVNLRYGCQS